MCCADVTYIPMRRGFLYLVAIMDWATRKVLAWRLSNTMDAGFCVAALEEALARFGKPEIFNTDQGSQFTSQAFTTVLREADVRIGMDGRGRWMDNVRDKAKVVDPGNADLSIPPRKKHLHDVRRTFCTYLCKTDLTNEEIGRIMAWAPDRVVTRSIVNMRWCVQVSTGTGRARLVS